MTLFAKEAQNDTDDVLIIDADAFGLLRKELIETLGMIEARRMLSRFGYMRGYRDAHRDDARRRHGQDRI